MSLKPPISPNSSVASAGLGTSPRIINAGNLGSSYSLDVDEDVWVWLVGTLNADCTITFSNEVEGSSILLLLTQDGTGGRSVTVSDGSTPTVIGQISTVAGAFSPVRVDCTSSTAYKAYSLQGQQGVPGDALGVLGVDVWASQANPEAITDWGPTINSLVSGGTKLLLFRGEEFPFSTQIDVTNTTGVAFAGEGSGALHPTLEVNPVSQLVWKGGAGSGEAIDASGSDGFTLRDLAAVYDVDAYDEDLILFGMGSTQTGSPVVERCVIGTKSRADATAGNGQARSCINASFMVGGRVHQNAFRGARWAVRGAEPAQGGFASGVDDNKFFENMFESCLDGYFCNIGAFWKIHYNTFYGDAFGAYPTPTIIDYDGTGTKKSIFSYCFNEHWDGEPPLEQHVDNTWVARINGNDFFSPTAPAMVFDGEAQILVVEDNYFELSLTDGGQALIDLGDPATAFKSYGRIKGNYCGVSGDGATWAAMVSNVEDHGNLEIDNAIHRLLRDVGQERARDASHGGTTAAITSGQTATEVRLVGNDSAGIIYINTAKTTHTAGALVDITFHKPIPRGNTGNPAHSGAQEVPSVILQPIVINTSSIAVAQDVNAYPKHATGPVNTGWQLAIRNVPASDSAIAYAYRVVQT